MHAFITKTTAVGVQQTVKVYKGFKNKIEGNNASVYSLIKVNSLIGRINLN